MESPQGNLLDSLIERLKLKVPELRYIEQDLGQLENYDIRPAVSWPCSLIDIDDTIFSDAGDMMIQVGVGGIVIRTGLVQYSKATNLVGGDVRVNALKFYEVEHKIYKALHGWNPDGFGKLMRVKTGTEKRDDDIRVRISMFSYSYTDDSAKPVRTSVPRPGITIDGSTTTST